MLKPVRAAGHSNVEIVQPETPATPAATRSTVTFTIPLRDAHEKPAGSCGNACEGCACGSKAALPAAGVTKASAVLSGVVLSETVVMGRRISAEALEVLKTAYARTEDGKGFLVPEDKLAAAKRELLRLWGFPQSFVREYGAQVKLEQVPDTTSVVHPDGSVYGDFGDSRTRFFGFVHKNDDWTKAGIDGIMSVVVVPEAAKRLTLPEFFYERNGVTTREEREVLRERLHGALSNWNTISDAELSWAKAVLTTGYQIEGELRLQTFAKGDSAVDAGQTLRGTVAVDNKVKSFGLSLESGSQALAPGGLSVRFVTG